MISVRREGFKNVSGEAYQSIYFLVYMGYCLLDIFVLTFFVNETMLFNDELSYSLFESNWIEQSNIDKKLVIVVMEAIKQPHQLFIEKLYPFRLETLRKVN